MEDKVVWGVVLSLSLIFYFTIFMFGMMDAFYMFDEAPDYDLIDSSDYVPPDIR